MYLRRDTLAALLNANAELTLAQALEELRIPLGGIDATINPEDWFVIGQRLGHGGGSVGAGGAGTRTQIGLRCSNATGLNPGLVVMEQVSVSLAGGAAGAVQVRANFLEVVSNAGFVRDGRYGTLATRTTHGFVVSQNTAAASGTLVGTLMRVQAADSKTMPYTAIIPPGQSLAFDPAADNLALEAFFFWRELDLRQR